MTIPNVVLTAALDRALQPRDITLYVLLYTELDVASYRPLKHVWLARRVGLNRSNTVRAVGRLIERGYLEQGPSDGGLCTYRIVLSPHPAVQTPRKDRRSAPREPLPSSG